MKENFVSRQQVNLLPERLRKAEETNAAIELDCYMWDLFEKKFFKPLKIMIVGAGGSYPAALVGKHALHNEMRTPNVEAVMPQTAIRILSQFDNILGCDHKPIYDLVIGVSYSGKSPDIIAVANLCIKKKFPFVLLTGASRFDLLDLFYKESKYCKIISYFNPKDTTGKEKGMISMFSTLAPAVIFDDLGSKSIIENQECLSKGEKFVNSLDIDGIAKAIKKFPIIHVFYDWTNLPTAVDIQSKFTESGIANVILHEKKNFSHGCYTALYNLRFALVINLVRFRCGIYLDSLTTSKFYHNSYDECLSTFLNKRCEDLSAHYIELGTTLMFPSQWNVEEMSVLPYLVTSIGEELDIDISKPLAPFPKEAIELYNYKGDF